LPKSTSPRRRQHAQAPRRLLDGDRRVEHFRLVVHPSGQTSFQSFLTVTGAAAGCGAGTMHFVVEGQGSGPVTEGHLGTIGQGSSTVDVHAELDFSAFVPTGTITYSGTYHCG